MIKKIFALIWQLPQVIVGMITLIVMIIKRRSRKINFFDRTGTLIMMCFEKNIGVSFGPLIFIGESPMEKTVNHEIGHSIQSRRWGLLYLLVIGLPSIIRAFLWRILKLDAKTYYRGWPENNADRLGGVQR
jgi:hypothetical protein